jgi:type 1 glutamine amidotransferase
MKKVLLVLSGWLHPPYRGRLELKELLGALPGFTFDEVSSLTEAAPRGLSAYDAAVLYYHYPKVALPPEELAAFRSFVEDGGGVLAVHSATASYKPTPAYFEVLGGRFVGHGPIQPFVVRPARDDDPIFGGIPAFTVDDELYVHERQPDIDVHFVADHDGKAEPIVWTRTFGKGRVCYSCPGHRAASMRHEAVREIVRRGMKWVSGV